MSNPYKPKDLVHPKWSVIPSEPMSVKSVHGEHVTVSTEYGNEHTFHHTDLVRHHEGIKPVQEATMTNFVELAQQKKAADFQTQLAEVLGQKVADALGTKKVEVASAMFGEDTINELSKKTLGSYIGKAADSMAMAHGEKMVAQERGAEVSRFTNRNGIKGGSSKLKDDMEKAVGGDNDTVRKHFGKVVKRSVGIGKATARLTK